MTKIADDYIYVDMNNTVSIENVDDNPFEQVGKLTMTPQMRLDLFGKTIEDAKEENELLRFETAKPLEKGKATELPDLLKFAMGH